MPIKAWFLLCNVKVDQFCAMIPILPLLEIFNFQIFFAIYFNFSNFLLSLTFIYFYLFLGSSFSLFQCYLKKPLVILNIQLVTFQVGLPQIILAICFLFPNICYLPSIADYLQLQFLLQFYLCFNLQKSILLPNYLMISKNFHPACTRDVTAWLDLLSSIICPFSILKKACFRFITFQYFSLSFHLFFFITYTITTQ